MNQIETSESHRLLRPDDVSHLLGEIQAMISAGVPIGLGLRQSSAGYTANLDEAAKRIARRLEQGASIADACREESSLPVELRPVLVAGFRCGESSKVLSEISEMTRSLQSLARSLQIGLIYPLVVTVTALVLFGVMTSVLLTAFLDIYLDLHAELPVWLFWIEPVVRNPGLTWAVIGIASFLVVVGFFLTGRTRGQFLVVPGVFQIRRDFQISHFSHLLSLLVSYGVPLPESLRLTGDAVTGPGVSTECDQLAGLIERGDSIDVAISSLRHFPDFLKWLIVTGHRDSQLPRALNEAAQYYRRRAEQRARWLGTILPTAAMLVLGGGVTFLYVMTVFGPMTNLWTKLAEY